MEGKEPEVQVVHGDDKKIAELDILGAVEALEDVPIAYMKDIQTIIQDIRLMTDSNELYYKCLSLLRLGKLSAEIPRLVVFGQQSMGKTTLLDFIMGGPIGYSSTDTGTKQPVVIVLHPGEKLECKFLDKTMSPRELQEAMAIHMKSAGDNISDKELYVEICVPGGVYAVFVDLPGIKDDSKAGSVLTKSVVRNYVHNNPNDLYVLVKKASDDPANWPWPLKEFILSNAPRGLGLMKRQTMVVGTRAREFIASEKNDIRTQQELLKRVTKRGVVDSAGDQLPLYLLELYSLDMDTKQHASFSEQKKAMYEQIKAGKEAVMEILKDFAIGSMEEHSTLLRHFDASLFKKELNSKFQNLLNEQLAVLEKRLLKKYLSTKTTSSDMRDQSTNFTASACRENIRLFIRQLVDIAASMMTGTYSILNLDDKGIEFLNNNGGSLLDNLYDGNDLATKLYPHPLDYNEEYYQTSVVQLRELKQSVMEQIRPNIWKQGTEVRFQIPKNEASMYGVVEATPDMSEKEEGDESVEVSVYFYVKNPSKEEELAQPKIVASDCLTAVKPLPSSFTKEQHGTELEVWHKSSRSDGWVGFKKVYVEVDAIVAAGGEANALVNIHEGDGEDGDGGMDLEGGIAAIKDLYVDKVEEESTEEPEVNRLSVIARSVDLKLVHQSSLAALSSWMQNQLINARATEEITNQVMLQMMRGVNLVMDRTDWQPLVTDLLRKNVRRNMLNLTKLASCAAGVALRRILVAATDELKRNLKINYSKLGVITLSENKRFMEELNDAVDEFCQAKSMSSVAYMENQLVEQTHNVRFEVIDDFFEGCCVFEEEYIGTSNIRKTQKLVNEFLDRKERGFNAIGSKMVAMEKKIQELLYQEVRMQIWVVQMLVAVPLSSKVFTHFTRGIQDKIKYINGMHYSPRTECELETFLQMKILRDRAHDYDLPKMLQLNQLEGYREISDLDLMNYFHMGGNLQDFETKIAGLERTNAYVRVCQEAVSKLRQQIIRSGGVDFLTRLDVDNIGLLVEEGGEIESTV